jgi:hypothetical protein
MKYYYDIENCETIIEKERENDISDDTVLMYLLFFIAFCFTVFMMNMHDAEVKNLRDFCLNNF